MAQDQILPNGTSVEVPPFAQIFREHRSHMWRTLRRLGVSTRDIEDVCQDVFVIVHQKLSTFEGRSSIKTWIYGICVRVAADYRKRAYRRHEELVDELPTPIAQANQHKDLVAHEMAAALDAALDKLDDEKRSVFVLFELEGLPMADVALAVGCKLDTAYYRHRKACEQVMAALRRHTGERMDR